MGNISLKLSYTVFKRNQTIAYIDEGITLKNSEMNTLHFIFSEKHYFKPVLDSDYTDEAGNIVPKSLTRRQFENWLAGNKTSISDFLDVKVQIEILREK